MSKMLQLPPKAKLTREQEQAMVEARVAFMNFCPFFCFYYYDQLQEYPTHVIETLAVDGRRIFINPEYITALKPVERAFALAHEVYHAIRQHPQRMRYYGSEGTIKGLPYLGPLFNVAADYVINADLIDNNIGACHPSWLYDKNITADEVPEDVYVRLYNKKPPPPPFGGQPGDPGGGGGQPGDEQPVNPGPSGGNKVRGDVQKSTRHDRAAESAGGAFDTVLEPFTDPTTGKEDAPSGMEFTEAVARAAAAAKAVGNMPASFQSMVDEILEPTVDWREHLRMLVVGRIGHRKEDWSRPNRRRLVLNPIVIMPGKRGTGSRLVVIAVDTSGSISDRELSAFFGEMTAILADCRPRRVMIIWCDAVVQRVDEASSLDELAHIRQKGVPGRGGTSFIPPFAYLEAERITPDTLVYLTDMIGPFPSDPKYPVIWAATTGVIGPFGETVRVEVA